MEDSQRQLVMDERAVERALARMAREIVERNAGVAELAIVGVQRRGVQLAARIADEIEKAEGERPAVGTLDITLYRDDLTAIGPRPVLGETRLPPGGIDGRRVVIVDDVCYTGRTARAALDEMADFGRPARIYLCVLVDRGGRELPIQPDIVGRTIDASGDQRVEVLVPELDGRLAVELLTRGAAGQS
jgi:pyrimidine operon attenuation protein / uracil phosphoribosyltransferase